MAFIIASSLLCTISETVLPWQPMASRLRLATGVSSSVGSPVSGSRTHWGGGDMLLYEHDTYLQVCVPKVEIED